MKLRLRIIKAALTFIKVKFIDKISFEPLKDYLVELLDPFRQAIDRLTDKDPDNRRQLKELWKEIKDEVETDSIEALMKGIEAKVKDEATRELLLSILKDYLNETLQAQPAA